METHINKKNTFNRLHRVHWLCVVVHYAITWNDTWHVRLSCTWLLSEYEASRFQRPLKKPSYYHASWFQLPLKQHPYCNASRFQNPSTRLSYCHASNFQSTPTSIFNCMISPYSLHSYIKVSVSQKRIVHEKMSSAPICVFVYVNGEITRNSTRNTIFSSDNTRSMLLYPTMPLTNITSVIQSSIIDVDVSSTITSIWYHCPIHEIN